jgi:hypothetical protein
MASSPSSASRLAAARRQIARLAQERLFGTGQSPLQILRSLPRPREQVAFAGEVGPGVDDLLQRGAVLPLQPLEQRQPVLDLLQPRRRGVHAVGIAAQEVGEVLELRLDAVAGVHVRRELRVDGRQLADALPHAAQAREHGAVAVVQRAVALLAQPLQPLGARQHLARGELEGDQVEARRLLARVHPRAFELVAQRPHAGPGLGHPRRRRAELRVLVEQRQVRQRIEQRLVLVLAVQFDQLVRKVAQRRRGGQRAVDERAAAAGAGQLAPDDDLAACPERSRVAARVFEDGLDGGV